MNSQDRNIIFIKISIIISSIFIIYWSDFVIVLNEAIKSEISSYILILPFIVIYLLYRIKDIIYASFFLEYKNNSNINIKDTIGSLLCIFAYLLKWFGFYKFQTIEIHMISLPIFILGIILIMFNYDTLKIVFYPILFLFLLIPPPIEIATAIGSTLSIYTSQISYNILKLLNQPVSLNLYVDAPYITLIQNGQNVIFIIDIACSGMYSLIGFIIFSLFLSYISKGKFIKRIIVFFIGFALIYSLNVFRIILLIIIGRYIGQDIALNIFHFFGGWVLLFIGSTILIFINNKITDQNIEKESKLSKEVLKFLNNNYDVQNRIKINKSKLVSILILIFSTMLIQVPVIAITKGASELLTQETLTLDIKTVIPEIELYETQFIYRDQEFEEKSGQDVSMWLRYTPINNTLLLPVWVGIEIGPTRSCLHPWEVCLIDNWYRNDRIPNVIEIDRRDIQLLENPPISARYFTFHSKQDARTQVILYWYTQTTFQINQEYIKKWAKISLIAYLDSPEDYFEVEEYLFPFSQEIVSHWYPTSKWSDLISAFTYEGIVSLLYIDVILLFLVSVFNIYKKREKIIKSRLLYKNLQYSQDMAFLNTILNLGDKKATLDNITLRYNHDNDMNLSIKEVYDKLLTVQKIGIINKNIFNDKGNPNYHWTIIHNNYLSRLYSKIINKTTLNIKME